MDRRITLFVNKQICMYLVEIYEKKPPHDLFHIIFYRRKNLFHLNYEVYIQFIY